MDCILLGRPNSDKTIVYDDSATIDLDNVALNGGFLVKTVALSLDFFIALKMRNPNIPLPYVSFRPAFRFYVLMTG